MPLSTDVEMEEQMFLKILLWLGNSSDISNIRVLFRSPCIVYMPRFKLPKTVPASSFPPNSPILYGAEKHTHRLAIYSMQSCAYIWLLTHLALVWQISSDNTQGRKWCSF